MLIEKIETTSIVWRGKFKPIYKAIKALNPGESIKVTLDEPVRCLGSMIQKNLKKNYGIKVCINRLGSDHLTWAVLREQNCPHFKKGDKNG